jgi:hypothetical protein
MMKIIRGWLLLFLMGIAISGWAQWNSNLSQNTRVSAGAMHTFAYGAVAGDDGSVLVTWAESIGNASIMFAQRYRADGTVAFAKKELFRYTFADCTKEGFSGMKLLKAAGSDDVFVIYNVNTTLVIQGGLTTYLQYQIISFNDGTTKIPNNGNENRGLNLGYNYGTTAPGVSFDAHFIRDGGSKVAITWAQKNNPLDLNRGGGGILTNLTDLRIAILDASNRTAPTAYFVEGDAGEQTTPRVYAQGERLFVSFIDKTSNIAVRKYKYALNGTTITKEWGGNAQYLGVLPDPQNMGVQPSFDDSNPICVYSVSGSGAGKVIKAHRFNPASGASMGTSDIGVGDQIGGSKMVGNSGQFSLNVAFINTRNNRQIVRRYMGNTATSAETPITLRNHGGDPTFEGIKIADSPEKYLFVGENRDNGELYGQVIRFDNNSSEGVREWGDNGKIVSNASGNKTGGRLSVLNSNALFFLWRDERNRNSTCTADIYAQVLDANGNPPLSVTISKPSLNRGSLCVKDTLRISFTTTGTFTAGNVFTADILNEAGNSVVLTNFPGVTASPISIVLPTGLPNGRYRIRVKSSMPVANSLENSDVFTVTSTPVITATANGLKSLSVCSGAPVTLTSSNGFTMYSWKGPAGYTNSSQSPMLTSTIPGYYIVTGTSSCGTAKDSIQLSINQIPNAVDATNRTSYVSGETIQLKAPSGTGYTYAWTGPNGFMSTLQNPTIANAAVGMSGNYVVTVKANGCEAKNELMITVSNQPVTGITTVSANPGVVCPGANVSVSFVKQPSNGVATFNVFLTNSTGQKIGGSLGSGAASPLSVRIPDATPAGADYRLQVEVSDAVKAQSGALTVLQRASAQMISPRGDTSVVFRKAGDNLNVRVRVQGSGPFTLNFSGGSRTVRNAGDTTLSFRIENETTFTFQGVTGACGAGTLSGVQSSRISLKRVVAIEADSLGRPAVTVFPNPAAHKLTIQLRDNLPTNVTTEVRMFDLKGSVVKKVTFRNLQHDWDISSLPSGFYVVEVVRAETRHTFKIRKE